MSIITFLFKGGEVPIQCTPKEKLVTIIQRFCQKAEVNRNNVIFLFDGGILDEYITEDKIPKNEQNKKFITVDYNINDDDQNVVIIKSNDIICPKCKECASISINDDYKISLSNCKNGHKIENILISEFQKTQDINISKIICDRCKNKNMGEVFNKEFYRCINCKMNLCPLCKKEHNLNHNMIIYQNKFYICEEHGEPFISFCNECNKNLCFTCEEKHSNHQITDFKKLRKNKNDLEKELNIFKGYLDKIKKIAEDDMKNSNEKSNKVIKNFEIIYQIKKDIFTNNEVNLRNLQKLLNQDFIIKKYEEDFLSIINENNMNNRDVKISEIYERMESEFKAAGGQKKNSMKIFIQTVTGKLIPFDVKPNDKIENVKLKFQEQEGLHPELQRLIFSGIQLEDNKTFADYNIKNESKIHLILKLK